MIQFHFQVYTPKDLKAAAQTDLYTNVHNRIMHTIQKVGVIQMSINGEMDKQRAVYLHNGILFTLKKGDSAICGNTDGHYGLYAQLNKPVTEGQVLHDSICMRYLKWSNSWRESLY